MRLGRTVLVGGTVLLAACGGPADQQLNVVDLGDVRPGETVGLIATEAEGDRFVEWLDRVEGTIHRVEIDAVTDGMETIASVEVGTTVDGDQRGLLGQAVIDGHRFAAWTRPGTFELVVAELLPDGTERVVWSAGDAGEGAIGGVLHASADGDLLIGLGRNTAWDRDTKVGGAILVLDPDAGPNQSETIIGTGYTNPWAFTVADGGAVWVADNAAGPDPDDESRDDVERVGRADLQADRNEMAEVPWDERAPSAMVVLPDGRLGICGFLDNELRAYDIVETGDPQQAPLERAGTIMPCLTGAAVFDDGTIATIAQTDDGMALHILRP